MGVTATSGWLKTTTLVEHHRPKSYDGLPKNSAAIEATWLIMCKKEIPEFTARPECKGALYGFCVKFRVTDSKVCSPADRRHAGNACRSRGSDVRFRRGDRRARVPRRCHPAHAPAGLRPQELQAGCGIGQLSGTEAVLQNGA